MRRPWDCSRSCGLHGSHRKLRGNNHVGAKSFCIMTIFTCHRRKPSSRCIARRSNAVPTSPPQPVVQRCCTAKPNQRPRHIARSSTRYPKHIRMSAMSRSTRDSQDRTANQRRRCSKGHVLGGRDVIGRSAVPFALDVADFVRAVMARSRDGPRACRFALRSGSRGGARRAVGL